MGDEIEQYAQLLVTGESYLIHTILDFTTEEETHVNKFKRKLCPKLLSKYKKKLKDLLSSKDKNVSCLDHNDLMRFFDLLIPDWKFRNETESFYYLHDKNSEIKKLTDLSIAEQMFMLLKAKDKSIFHYTAYSILIQYCYEIFMDEKNFEKFQINFYELKSLLEGINEDYKEYVLLMMAGFPNGTKIEPELLMLRERLREGFLPKFKDKFKKIIKEEKIRCGTFYEVSIKPLARFYYFNATWSDSDAELIFRLFPHVEENSSLVSRFHEQRNLWIFDNDSKSDDKLKNIYELLICCRIKTKLMKFGLPDKCQSDCKMESEFSKIRDDDIAEMLRKEKTRFPFMSNRIEQILSILSNDNNKLNPKNFDELPISFLKKDIKTLKKEIRTAVETLMILNERQSYTVLFGRNIERPESLFEILLTITQIAKVEDEEQDLIKLIWDKFSLSHIPEILSNKNHLGHTLFKYVFESGDPYILFSIIRCCQYYEFVNSECQRILQMSLFEYYVRLSVTHASDENLISNFYDEVVLALLEEHDVEQLPVERLLNLSEDVDYHKTLKIWHEIEKDTLSRAKFDIHDVLCIVVGYMNPKNIKKDLKLKLEEHPVLNMIIMMKELDENQFVGSFNENMNKTESFVQKLDLTQKKGESCMYFIACFELTLLICAIINNKRKVIDKIFENQNFIHVPFGFPKNMKVYEGSYYAACKFLEAGFGGKIEEMNIPKEWMSPRIFEDFLDSRIKAKGDNLIEIDTSFLIHSLTKRYNIKKEEDVDDLLIFWDDTETLEYIRNNQWLKTFLTHPAIATYVELKWFKYKRIYTWNFWLYALLMVMYSLFVFGEIGVAFENGNSSWCPTCQYDGARILLKSFVSLTAVYMLLRECFQFYAINNMNFKKHFKLLSNRIEFVFIILVAITINLNILGERELFMYASCCSIFTMMMILISMFPYSFMFLHMALFKKVIKTFAKFIFTFLTLLFSYMLIFGMIFDLTVVKNINRTANSTNTEKNQLADRNNNFNNLGSAGLKVMLMLSGEFAIEPSDLDVIQMFIFLTFVLTTYILFNLIIGLTIDDVQQLREDALRIVVEAQIEKIVQTNRLYKEIFKKYRKYNKVKNKFPVKRFFKWLQYFFMKFLISRFPYLHGIDKIYVNLETQKVQMRVDKKYKFPVEYSLLKFDLEALFTKSPCLEEENIKKLTDIFRKRKDGK